MRTALPWFPNQTKILQDKQTSTKLQTRISHVHGYAGFKHSCVKSYSMIYHKDNKPWSGGDYPPGRQGWVNIWKSVNLIYHINKLKKKNYGNIPMIFNQKKKRFSKIQHNFMIKTVSKSGIEGNCLDLIKGTHELLATNALLGDKRLNVFSQD